LIQVPVKIGASFNETPPKLRFYGFLIAPGAE
jgi:hypothetical protein